VRELVCVNLQGKVVALQDCSMHASFIVCML